jgi:ribonuclease-3
MKKNFEELAKHIKVSFSDIGLLEMACTHRSFLNENKTKAMEHNERLEFLGDAVLELVVTSFLYRKYPQKAEGALTAYRSSIVNTVSLTKVAEHIGLNDYILLSKGETKDTGRARSIILANTVEAIIGAIYLDQGYDGSANFISNFILDIIDIEDIVANKTWIDAKSRFQEKAQEKVEAEKKYEETKVELLVEGREGLIQQSTAKKAILRIVNFFDLPQDFQK